MTTRRWLHGIMVKLGRDPRAHPPDDRIVAQFLAISEWPRLTRVLDDLVAERKEPGYSYAWFVSVALQRVHGIQPAVLKHRRAQLRIVPPGAPPPQQPQQPADPEYSRDLIAAAVAGVKSMP